MSRERRGEGLTISKLLKQLLDYADDYGLDAEISLRLRKRDAADSLEYAEHAPIAGMMARDDQLFVCCERSQLTMHDCATPAADQK